jgi:hypothetical protein
MAPQASTLLSYAAVRPLDFSGATARFRYVHSHREFAAAVVWADLVVAFNAGDIPRATRLGVYHDSLTEQSDDEYLSDLTEV